MEKNSSMRHDQSVKIDDFYTLDKELGRGSFGVVYKAISKKDNKSYAAKTIDKQKVKDKWEMVENEISVLQRVNFHPNIIQLFEIFESSTNVTLIMELIHGGELFDRIVELQHYSEENASEIVHQIFSAVDVLHKSKIVHRDLKPENLLLVTANDCNIKLADFGLSSIIKSNELLTKAVGTPGYIAPEILQTLDEDIAGYSLEVDNWSVGVITYILLCGFPPFFGEDDDEVFDKIIACQYTFPSPYWDSISASAKDLIKKLFVLDPKKRLTAEEALEHPWIKEKCAHSGHLPKTLDELRKFQAQKNWKKGINTVVAFNKFQSGLVRKKKVGSPTEANTTLNSALKNLSLGIKK